MNHGTVAHEIIEYREPTQRIIVCELTDGWHVVEVYQTNQRTIRHVVETLAEARAWALGRLTSRRARP